MTFGRVAGAIFLNVPPLTFSPEESKEPQEQQDPQEEHDNRVGDGQVSQIRFTGHI